ncbi:UDP-N-acetylglucosamine 2-epimerase [Streptomyces clavuligerus]|uniref:UDP-N-acetylglucosamine 2-epimerase n=1 Tax=Streptomyces clavuligerus TaxID=1901 RepID=E2Q3M2_STRCL|nr:UDP-N-acetylglucosamine 2-epimerase [Streptomyces clavuligerus]
MPGPGPWSRCPVAAALATTGHRHVIVHTGRYDDPGLSDVCLLRAGDPGAESRPGGGLGPSRGAAGAALAGLDPVVRERRPDSVLVHGDTRAMPAGAPAAVKPRLPPPRGTCRRALGHACPRPGVGAGAQCSVRRRGQLSADAVTEAGDWRSAAAVFFAVAFLAVVFVAAFFAVVFFAAVFLAAVFFVAAFFAVAFLAVLRAAFLAGAGVSSSATGSDGVSTTTTAASSAPAGAPAGALALRVTRRRARGGAASVSAGASGAWGASGSTTGATGSGDGVSFASITTSDPVDLGAPAGADALRVARRRPRPRNAAASASAALLYSSSSGTNAGSGSATGSATSAATSATVCGACSGSGTGAAACSCSCGCSAPPRPRLRARLPPPPPPPTACGCSMCTITPRPLQWTQVSEKDSSRPWPTRLRVICTRPSEVTSATWCLVRSRPRHSSSRRITRSRLDSRTMSMKSTTTIPPRSRSRS